MKKVFGQTVRDLKREVNKKVLKVPGVEQKILDATSNEPWGPHGTVLAELAQASRNNIECQHIMVVTWKRLNDTGKNWRHVFKALTVLEYLVAHGSERVIEEIREHGHQISTLAEFQYVDSNGRDQGINVRKKSQNLVALINDKDRIQEIRLKAKINKDKYHGSPGGYGDRCDDDRYGDQRNGYRDDDKYGNGYGRDSYRVGDYGGNRDHANEYQIRSRSQSVDSFDDDHRQMPQSSNGKANDQYLNERGLEHNEASPSIYEEAIRDYNDTIQNGRDEETSADSSHNVSSPAAPKSTSPSKGTVQGTNNAESDESVSFQDPLDTFDEFDPRGSESAVQPAATSSEFDFFGLSTSDSGNPLAVVLEKPTTSQADIHTDSVFGDDFFGASSSASPALDQPNENPFGDSPFKAVPHENGGTQLQHLSQATIHPSNGTNGSETYPPPSSNGEMFSSFNFGDALSGLTYASATVYGQNNSSNPSFLASESPGEQSNDDILDSILPRTGSASIFPANEAQSLTSTYSQAEQNPFDSSGVEGTATYTQTADLNPFQTFGMTATKPSEDSSQQSLSNFQTTQMKSSQQSGTPHSQGLPIDVQTSPTNFFQSSPFAVAAPEASQGSQNNMQSAQMNFPQPSGPPANMQSAHMNFPQPSGPPTNMQSAHMNFPQPSGPPTNMQSAQMNFPQPSGPLNNMQSAQMNFPQPSGPRNNMQSAQMNFSQPSGPPTNMQLAQMNFPQTSGPPTNMQSAQMNFLQPSGPPTNMQSAQINQPSGPPTNMQPAHMNFPQPSGSPNNMQTSQLNYFQPPQLPAPEASQGSQTNMSTAQLNFPRPSGSPTNMQASHMSFFRPSQLSAPAASQGPQTSMQAAQMNFHQPSEPPNYMQASQMGFFPPSQTALPASQGSQPNMQSAQMNFFQQSGFSAPVASQAQSNSVAASQGLQYQAQLSQGALPTNLLPSQSSHLYTSSHSMPLDPFTMQSSIASPGPTSKSQLSSQKFETKSTVWADTLSRGLINLDISGQKTNPLADIGVDFAAINRKEKRLEPKTAVPLVTSTITMGKAMGSGSGIGRVSAGGLASPPNAMMGPGMGPLGPMGMGMGGYGGNMNQMPMGLNMGMNGMGMGGGMNMGLGMGMNMGMGQGAQMRPASGMQPPDPGMPGGGYNPMMGMGGGGYGPQNPYGGGGGGYR